MPDGEAAIGQSNCDSQVQSHSDRSRLDHHASGKSSARPLLFRVYLGNHLASCTQLNDSEASDNPAQYNDNRGHLEKTQDLHHRRCGCSLEPSLPDMPALNVGSRRSRALLLAFGAVVLLYIRLQQATCQPTPPVDGVCGQRDTAAAAAAHDEFSYDNVIAPARGAGIQFSGASVPIQADNSPDREQRLCRDGSSCSPPPVFLRRHPGLHSQCAPVHARRDSPGEPRILAMARLVGDDGRSSGIRAQACSGWLALGKAHKSFALALLRVNALIAHIITPAIGAHFSMYLADMAANASASQPEAGVER